MQFSIFTIVFINYNIFFDIISISLLFLGLSETTSLPINYNMIFFDDRLQYENEQYYN